jgi:hypothetical protein
MESFCVIGGTPFQSSTTTVESFSIGDTSFQSGSTTMESFSTGSTSFQSSTTSTTSMESFSIGGIPFQSAVGCFAILFFLHRFLGNQPFAIIRFFIIRFLL